jgi:hypothetical protein
MAGGDSQWVGDTRKIETGIVCQAAGLVADDTGNDSILTDGGAGKLDARQSIRTLAA